MIDTRAVRKTVRQMSRHEPRLFRAPGRVNLIGEHTDYNDGFVLPMAIDRETVVAAAPREDRCVRVLSLNANELVEFDLDEPGPVRRGLWIDYVEGMARALDDRHGRLRGADCVLQSDVPEGSGLSSSAALEVSTGLALAVLSGLEISRTELALAGQRAEHQYVGTLNGIMDQFIAALGRAGHALFIDCRTLEADPVPIDLSSAVVVICDSRVTHSLAGSQYNRRRSECEQGVALLRRVLPDIQALRDVSVLQFERHKDLLPDPIVRRCRHVVYENERTQDAVDALRTGAFDEMGRLMFASHASLRDEYDVSCRELDVLVEIARSVEGVLGARMTGGGFGGCTVNLVARGAVEVFRDRITHEYARETGHQPLIYISEAGEGASEILETSPGVDTALDG